jgi:hypothetical protein
MAEFCASLPVRIESEANRREHWSKAAARKKLHRQTARLALQHIRDRPPAGAAIVVTMRRIAPRNLDSDNLASGFKAVRDGIADWLGIDDGSPRITWLVEQGKGKPNEYSAHVVVNWGME